jgi:hypothetical protein
VWQFVETEQTTVVTKHKDELVVFRVNRLKEKTQSAV